MSVGRYNHQKEVNITKEVVRSIYLVAITQVSAEKPWRYDDKRRNEGLNTLFFIIDFGGKKKAVFKEGILLFLNSVWKENSWEKFCISELQRTAHLS